MSITSSTKSEKKWCCLVCKGVLQAGRTPKESTFRGEGAKGFGEGERPMAEIPEFLSLALTCLPVAESKEQRGSSHAHTSIEVNLI